MPAVESLAPAEPDFPLVGAIEQAKDISGPVAAELDGKNNITRLVIPGSIGRGIKGIPYIGLAMTEDTCESLP